VPGSIGQSSYPKRVFKGMKAAGHMGDERVTVQNLKVVKVDAENNLIALRGAVPGVEDGFVIIKEALKRGKGKDWKVVSKPAGTSKKSEKKEDSATEAKPSESPEKKD